jgi:chloride channel protein, CIC family
VFEMTNDYAIVLPLMLAVVICNLVARRIEHDSLYSGWLRRRGESIEHGADRDVLAGLRVADAYDPAPDAILEHEPANAFLHHLGHGGQVTFPVIDDEHCVRGVISVAELGQVAGLAAEARALVIAADLARPSETVLLTDSLLDVVRRMGVRGAPSLPVVDGEGHLLGLIARSHVLSVYERRVAGHGTADVEASRHQRRSP